MKIRIAHLLVPFAFLAAPEELRLGVKAGTTLTKTFETRMKASLDEMSMTVGDQEVPAEHFEGIEVSTLESSSLVFVDEYLELGDGMPLRLRRTFEELSKHSAESSSSPQGSNERTSDGESELEGMSVVFTWDEDEEEFSAEFDEEDGDEELLEDLEQDTDLIGFLPEGDVDRGDTWEVDVELMSQLLSPGGKLSFLDEDGKSDETELGDELEENAEGDISATFEGLEDVDGRTLAVISLEIDVDTTGDEETENEAGMTETNSLALGMVLEGELRWDVEAGHVAGFEISGDLELEMESVGSFGGRESRRKTRLSGTVELSLEVEADA